MQKLTIFSLSTALLVCAGVFDLKGRVNALQHDVNKTRTQIREHEQALHVLDAEWAYLTEPQDLEHLAATYTALKPLPSKQMIALSALPGAENGQPEIASLSNPTLNMAQFSAQ